MKQSMDAEKYLETSDPEEVRLLAEIGRKLGVEVLVDRGYRRVADSYRCREHARISEHVRIVEADVEGVESAHRETADSEALKESFRQADRELWHP